MWIAWQLEDANYSVVLQAWDFRPGGNFVFDMQKRNQLPWPPVRYFLARGPVDTRRLEGDKGFRRK